MFTFTLLVLYLCSGFLVCASSKVCWYQPSAQFSFWDSLMIRSLWLSCVVDYTVTSWAVACPELYVLKPFVQCPATLVSQLGIWWWYVDIAHSCPPQSVPCIRHGWLHAWQVSHTITIYHAHTNQVIYSSTFSIHHTYKTLAIAIAVIHQPTTWSAWYHTCPTSIVICQACALFYMSLWFLTESSGDFEYRTGQDTLFSLFNLSKLHVCC